MPAILFVNCNHTPEGLMLDGKSWERAFTSIEDALKFITPLAWWEKVLLWNPCNNFVLRRDSYINDKKLKVNL